MSFICFHELTYACRVHNLDRNGLSVLQQDLCDAPFSGRGHAHQLTHAQQGRAVTHSTGTRLQEVGRTQQDRLWRRRAGQLLGFRWCCCRWSGFFHWTQGRLELDCLSDKREELSNDLIVLPHDTTNPALVTKINRIIWYSKKPIDPDAVIRVFRDPLYEIISCFMLFISMLVFNLADKRLSNMNKKGSSFC